MRNSLPFSRVAVAALLVSFVVAGCKNVEPAPPPEAPRIASFTASKSRVATGEAVTLTFTTSGATKVEIIDDKGRSLVLAGSVESGTAMVAPTDTSFYVLRATGEGGRDTAFVQIAVNEPLRDLFLIAVPGTINSGDQAQLLWGAAGASTVTLTAGSGMAMALTGTTGAVTVTPATSERYTLTAQGAPGTPPLSALADVEVRPVLADATLNALDGVGPMKTVTLRWRTAGASRVIISEQTFGPLTEVTEPSSVVMGSYDFVIPDVLPSGIAVSDGLPLRFTVTALSANASVSRVLSTVVGDQPVIERFDAPQAATTAGTFTISWRTLNATAVEVNVGTLPVWSSLAGDLTRVTNGTVSLPAPSTQTEYTFVARNDRGARVTRTFTVRPVGPPVINTFTLTPTITTLGDSASARWTTTDAVRVQLRHENGPTLLTVTTPSQVASGNVGLLLASSTRVVLEATNAAGQSVTETRVFTFTGAVNLLPVPAVRGTPVTLDWTLAGAGVTEVVGLPTPEPAPSPGSPNFIDLVPSPTAVTLQIADPAEGTERIVQPSGFHFSLLGTVQNELWVSVNGFVALSDPGALSTNVDLSSSNSAPSIIAPFWDDLTMGVDSKIFVDTSTSPSGERFLIVQWEKLQIAGDQNSELTFQTHLYETGQIAFIYKTTTGTLTSATIGVQDKSWPAAQQYAFDSMTVAPSPGLELNYFTAGPATGMLTFNASGNKRINFFGRTAMSRMAASVELRTFGPGDFDLTEVMPLPEGTVATTGQWLEIRSRLPNTVDLAGLALTTNNSVDGGLLFPEGTWLDGGAFLVIGQNTDLSLNGGAPVTWASDDVALSVPGVAALTLNGSSLASLTWDAGTVGTSIVPRERLLLATGTQTCPRVATFGSAGAFGTPGLVNEPCTPSAPYVMSSIPGGFIAPPASAEIMAAYDGDEDFENFTLPAPFTAFGRLATSVGVSTNGFITLGAGDLDDPYFSNNAAVSSTSPNGVLAAFWDDLDRDAGAISMWRLADRTIVSWSNYSFFLDSSSVSSINAQVHLLDNGVIEMHYGTLSTTSTSTTTQARVLGGSATVWIEKYDGALAVPVSINTGTLVPNSGIRFTPN